MILECPALAFQNPVIRRTQEFCCMDKQVSFELTALVQSQGP